MSVGIDLDCREGIRAAGSIEFEGWPVGYQKLRLARERSQLCGEAGGQLRRRLSRQEPASAYRAIYAPFGVRQLFWSTDIIEMPLVE